MPTKQTISEQTDKLRNRLLGSYNRKFTQSFANTSEHLGVSLQKVINDKIDQSLKEMSKYNIFGSEKTPPALLFAPEPTQPWSPLTMQSKHEKGGLNAFFSLTGQLENQLETMHRVTSILGGYNAKNKKIGNALELPRGYVLKDGLVQNRSGKTVAIHHIQTTLRFSVFAKLEAALDSKTETKIFGTEGKIQYKLLGGLNSKSKTPVQRDILRSYYSFYTHVVLPNTIDAFLNTRKRR